MFKWEKKKKSWNQRNRIVFQPVIKAENCANKYGRPTGLEIDLNEIFFSLLFS